MLGWFNEKVIKKQLDIPKNEKIAMLITMAILQNLE